MTACVVGRQRDLRADAARPATAFFSDLAFGGGRSGFWALAGAFGFARGLIVALAWARAFGVAWSVGADFLLAPFDFPL
jgi:hypothetical protein